MSQLFAPFILNLLLICVTPLEHISSQWEFIRQSGPNFAWPLIIANFEHDIGAIRKVSLAGGGRVSKKLQIFYLGKNVDCGVDLNLNPLRG